jgi:hypothetical protein
MLMAAIDISEVIFKQVSTGANPTCLPGSGEPNGFATVGTAAFGLPR